MNVKDETVVAPSKPKKNARKKRRKTSETGEELTLRASKQDIVTQQKRSSASSKHSTDHGQKSTKMLGMRARCQNDDVSHGTERCNQSTATVEGHIISNLHDDVVDGDESLFRQAYLQQPSFGSTMPSTGKLFIESKGSFKAMDVQTFKMDTAAAPNSKTNDGKLNAVDICITLNKRIKQLAKWCQGTLGGVALLYCVLVYGFFTKPDFIHYSSLAITIQVLFYILLTISIVSLLESVDLDFDWNFLSCLNLGLLATMLYWIALLLSLTNADKDDALALSSGNITEASLQFQDEDFQVWKNVNLCRCLAVIIAWILLSFKSV